MNENRLKKKKIFKIAGVLVALAGLAAAIAGFADMGIAVKEGRFPELFFLLIVGLPCIAIGSMIALSGFRAEIVKGAVKDVAPALKELNDALTTTTEKEATEIACPRCGALNRSDSVFCYKCGAALCRECPECGKIADFRDEYCTKCGKKL